MAIRQITIFQCDECGEKIFQEKEVTLLDNEPVEPDGYRWGYRGYPTNERLMCPACLASYDSRRK